MVLQQICCFSCSNTGFAGGQLDICKYNEFGRKVGAESISAPVSLAYMDRADMESAPTVFIAPNNSDRFWMQMVIKYNPGWE